MTDTATDRDMNTDTATNTDVDADTVSSTDAQTIQPTTRVPNDETSTARCPYCDRPFRSERLRDIHVGDAHSDRWSDQERDRYETANDDEKDELFVYHLKSIAALVALYAALILVYMVVLSM